MGCALGVGLGRVCANEYQLQRASCVDRKAIKVILRPSVSLCAPHLVLIARQYVACCFAFT